MTTTRDFISRLTLWLLIGSPILLVAATWVGDQWARESAIAKVNDEARQLAVANAALFNSELEKFMLLPNVLAENPDVVRLLHNAHSSPASVNAQLEQLASRTGAAVIYVISPNGVTLAASNWRLEGSFVGKNYGFRPYFIGALAHGSSELFALGIVTGRPGLFLATRVGPPKAPAGVIVVKIEFDALERIWAQQKITSFVTDKHDVIIITARKEWRFRALRPLLARELADIARAHQFDRQQLQPLPATFSAKSALLGGSTQVRVVLPLKLPGARLNAFLPIQSALEGAKAKAHLAVFGLAVLLLGLALWQLRQFERASMRRAARRELELRVLERTAELRITNDALVREVGLRQRSEERYRRSREELAQANRLATMGQIAAGVAHEINQPVAAIRVLSENAKLLLARGNAERADANLARVVGLTERIAQITAELRNFARRRPAEAGPIALNEAIEAALLLVHHRVVSENVDVAWDRQTTEVTVYADRVRLEQVFVNLIQNALEAIVSCPAPQVAITADPCADGVVMVDVTDTGDGIPSAIRKRLFVPFVTGRKDGLGLGLAIARDILRDFGGDLSLLNSDRNGSTFRVRLRTA